MEIKGQPVHFQVYSGATCNLISKNDLPDECWIAHSNQVLSMFNGSKMEPLVNPKVDEECEAVDTPTDWVSSLVLNNSPNGKLLVPLSHSTKL